MQPERSVVVVAAAVIIIIITIIALVVALDRLILWRKWSQKSGAYLLSAAVNFTTPLSACWSGYKYIRRVMAGQARNTLLKFT